MLAVLVLATVGGAPTAACASPEDQPSGDDSDGQPEGSPAPGTPESEPEQTEFTLLSAGDVLPHTPVIEAARQPGGGYDFLPLMEPVGEWVEQADLSLCGMEVPVRAEGRAPSGYPEFGAPDELVEDLSALGFDGCTTATNHSLDGGIGALERTLDLFDEAGMGHVGTARSAEESEAAQMYRLSRGGREITVAHISTTLLHNVPPPQDSWWVTDVAADQLTALAASARDEGADLVLASVHWGEEYVDTPGAEEQRYAEQLAAGGEVDVVFGNHSHTPLPLRQLDGGPADEGMWVVWSMGNFLSNQDEQCCVPRTAVGTMVLADVEAPAEGRVRVTDLSWTPVTVDRTHGYRGILPLAELNELTELTDGELPEDTGLTEERVETRYQQLLEVMDEDSMATDPPRTEEPVEVEVLPRSD
ncbi:CapA family protein [Nesterenkonia aerolata]|uniref:CapA family protein n=1 Tax=Nesterenkonia aerolata TaxID=3074079 RepID=A0ABU2DTM3_9MICC|nr:CapA family protein [Nesterenkonia sp. LY-0111]MDR8019859.1 CapA family protein [Nesterenkonia sp. LY-0111]